MATKSQQSDDLGQAEMQKERDEAAAKGHVGTKPDGPGNEAYALTSGPDSPSALDAKIKATQTRADAMKGA